MLKRIQGDVLCAGRRDALIIVDARAPLAPTGEKWDDKRGNFLFLSRWCVIVWAPVRRGGGGVRCETSPSPFLLTKTLIHRNYTDGLKYTARQGITPIMQSWLKLGPHARVLQEHGRSQDVHQGSSEHVRPVNICTTTTRDTEEDWSVSLLAERKQHTVWWSDARGVVSASRQKANSSCWILAAP